MKCRLASGLLKYKEIISNNDIGNSSQDDLKTQIIYGKLNDEYEK